MDREEAAAKRPQQTARESMDEQCVPAGETATSEEATMITVLEQQHIFFSNPFLA